MAYQAPKWTQMTAPSATTSVNALTAAGDLFSKAMESAQTGLTNYDKGVESRLQDDSDVNTAALRRRLEGAGSLQELNAMQGDISATGLERYGKRIDADALQASFDKERGVLRGEDEQQYGEQFQQQLNDATTIEEYTAIRDGMSANPTWYDDASRIQSLGAGMEGARTLEANTASTALSKSFVGKSYDELAAMAKLVKPGDLNADQDLAAIASQQKLVRSDAQTDYDNSGEKSLLAAAKKGGRGALEAEMARLTTEASKPGSKIDLSNVLSTYQGLVPGANETTATNTVVGAVTNQSEMFATNDAAILSVVTGLGAEQYVTVNPVTGQPTFKPGTPEAIRNSVIAGLADAGYVTPPKGVANKTEFINNLLEQGIPLKIANQMHEDTDTTLANTYELTGAGKEALATQTVGFTTTQQRTIADATSIRDAARLQEGNNAANIASAIEGPKDIGQWVSARMGDSEGLNVSLGEDAQEMRGKINSMLENGIGNPDSEEEGAWIAGKDINWDLAKLIITRNMDNSNNYDGSLDQFDELVLAMHADEKVNGQVARVLAVEKTFNDSVTAADSTFAASRAAASTELKLKYDVRSTTNMDPSIAQEADSSEIGSTGNTSGEDALRNKLRLDAQAAQAAKKDAEFLNRNSIFNSLLGNATPRTTIAENTELSAALAGDIPTAPVFKFDPSYTAMDVPGAETPLPGEDFTPYPAIGQTRTPQQPPLTKYENTIIDEGRGTIEALKTYNKAVNLAMQEGDTDSIQRIKDILNKLGDGTMNLGVAPMVEELTAKIASANT